MKTQLTWKASDTKDAQYIGVIEFQDDKGEWHNFEVLGNTDRLIFGGFTNTGFLESGFIRREDGELTDDTLSELVLDLETFYNHGASHVFRIVCNERM